MTYWLRFATSCLIAVWCASCSDDSGESSVASNRGSKPPAAAPEPEPAEHHDAGAPSGRASEDTRAERDASAAPAAEPEPSELAEPQPSEPAEPEPAEPAPAEPAPEAAEPESTSLPEPDSPPEPDAAPSGTADPPAPEPPPEPEPVVEPSLPLDAMNDPIENDAVCPGDEPAEGDPCPEYRLVCKYGSELYCRSRWICASDGTWWPDYGPRDCPESCPESEPVEGDPCDVANAVCDFGDAANCRAQWLCFEGVWGRTFYGDCQDTTVCPEAQPDNGTECELTEVTPLAGRCIYQGGAVCGCGCSWQGDALSTQWNCWYSPAGYPPSYLTACPPEQPEPGSECGPNNTSTCGYPAGDQCAAPDVGYLLANCVEGQWVITGP